MKHQRGRVTIVAYPKQEALLPFDGVVQPGATGALPRRFERTLFGATNAGWRIPLG